MKLNANTQRKNADADFYQEEITNAESLSELQSVIDDIKADSKALGIHRRNLLLLLRNANSKAKALK